MITPPLNAVDTAWFIRRRTSLPSLMLEGYQRSPTLKEGPGDRPPIAAPRGRPAGQTDRPAGGGVEGGWGLMRLLPRCLSHCNIHEWLANTLRSPWDRIQTNGFPAHGSSFLRSGGSPEGVRWVWSKTDCLSGGFSFFSFLLQSVDENLL